MIDLDEISISAVVPARPKNGAVGSRGDWRPVRTGEVDARVHGSAGAERVGTDAEAACELDIHLHRLVGRNGDDAVLKLVELLPAVEQRLEAGIANALERTADAGVAANAGRGNAQALQFGGGDLVANVERLGDESGLLKLGLLHASQRTILRK